MLDYRDYYVQAFVRIVKGGLPAIEQRTALTNPL